jgi:hypothetical protein
LQVLQAAQVAIGIEPLVKGLSSCGFAEHCERKTQCKSTCQCDRHTASAARVNGHRLAPIAAGWHYKLAGAHVHPGLAKVTLV